MLNLAKSKRGVGVLTNQARAQQKRNINSSNSSPIDNRWFSYSIVSYVSNALKDPSSDSPLCVDPSSASPTTPHRSHARPCRRSTLQCVALIFPACHLDADAMMCSTVYGGVANDNVCCAAGCGSCGGTGCSSRGLPDLDAYDCCTGPIMAANDLCEDVKSAPCVLEATTGVYMYMYI